MFTVSGLIAADIGLLRKLKKGLELRNRAPVLQATIKLLS
jgi:hypothetical protein